MTRLRGMLVALAGAALLASGPASATQAGPAAATKDTASQTVSGVTVTAEKPNPLVDRTTEFVRQRLPESRFGQYARFRDPVCVKVQGLPSEFDDFIAKRIVEIANQVHAPVANASICTPNVNVIFSAQPQAQLEDITKRRNILFGFYFAAQLKRLATFDRPVQSWYLTRAVGTDGQDILELNQSNAFSEPPPDKPGGGPVGSGATVRGRAGSRLGNDLSSELVHSLILADANKVSGEKIGAVADYIAILALSRWQGLERCSSVSTILNLMAAGCDAEDRPETATPADLALLTGLYAVDPRELGPQQRASIADQMSRAAANGEARSTARK